MSSAADAPTVSATQIAVTDSARTNKLIVSSLFDGHERRLKPLFFVPSVYSDITHIFPCQTTVYISYEIPVDVRCLESAILLATLKLRPPHGGPTIRASGTSAHDVTRGTANVGGRQRLSAHSLRHHFRRAHALGASPSRCHEGRLRRQHLDAARGPQPPDVRGVCGCRRPARIRGGPHLDPEPARARRPAHPAGASCDGRVVPCRRCRVGGPRGVRASQAGGHRTHRPQGGRRSRAAQAL